MTLPTSVTDLIDNGRLAHLTTIDPDGAPQTTVVWIGHEDGEVVVGHMHRHRKLRNIERDPRVTLSFLGEDDPIGNLHPYIVINGTGRITHGGALTLLRRLAKVYLGPDATFLPEKGDDDTAGFVLRIAASRIGGVGPWTT